MAIKKDIWNNGKNKTKDLGKIIIGGIGIIILADLFKNLWKK
jgi:hypothetical protein